MIVVEIAARAPGPVLRFLITGLLALTLGACAGDGAHPPPPANEMTVPEVDLDSTSDRVRERVRSLESAIENARGQENEALGEAFGELGQLYLAYEFYEPSAQCFERAIRLAREEPRWWYYDGIGKQTAGFPEEAEARFERAAELLPQDVAVWIRLGRARLDQADLDGARAAFSNASRLDPFAPAPQYDLGRVEKAAGMTAKAIDHFERALELQPTATIVHYQLSQLYRQMDDPEKAQRHLELRGNGPVSLSDPLAQELRLKRVATAFDVVSELAEQDRSLPEEEILGYAVVYFGDLGGATEELEKALIDSGELDERTGSRIRYILGVLYARQGDDARAIEHLRMALAFDPGFEDARLSLAKALVREGRPDEALKEVDAALQLDPRSPGALLQRADVLSRQGSAANAARTLETLLKIDPVSVEARLRLARLRQEAGALDDARLLLTEILGLEQATDAQRSMAAFQLGRLAGSDVDEAVSRLKAAVSLDPGNVDARWALAARLGASGNYAEAARQYAELVRLEPANAPARMGEITSLILLQRHAEARSKLELAVEAVPEDPSLMRALIRHLAACPDRSVRDGRRALELAVRATKNDPSIQNEESLAMALAETGDFAAAAARQEALLKRIAPDDTATLARLRANLRLYREGRACCAPVVAAP